MIKNISLIAFFLMSGLLFSQEKFSFKTAIVEGDKVAYVGEIEVEDSKIEIYYKSLDSKVVFPVKKTIDTKILKVYKTTEDYKLTDSVFRFTLNLIPENNYKRLIIDDKDSFTGVVHTTTVILD